MSTDIVRDMLELMLSPGDADMAPEVARYFLSLQFTDAQRLRISDLAAKCNEGALSSAERDEYEAIVMLGEFLALMQAKARASLQRHSTAA